MNMGYETQQMHSHSGLEGALGFPKHIVLVDARFASIFHKNGINTTPFKHMNVEYIKVPILAFVKCGGVFKNFNS